jgi:hypothetical protein
MNDSSKIIAETKAIKVHPWWHTVLYVVMALIFGVFIFMILDNLTDRVNSAERTAAANANAVVALAEQVEDLGGTPVVEPDDVLQRGETGAPGADGLPGIPGPVGPAGKNGSDGQDGSDGLNGRDGTDGAQGVAGVAGAPGEDATGIPGQTGPAGPAGQDGKDGADGKDGEDGAIGPVGPPGPAGQSCPEGYALEQRTIMTAENPLGEPGWVCVQSMPNNDDTIERG